MSYHLLTWRDPIIGEAPICLELARHQVTGLVLRVAAGGAKSWSVQFLRQCDGRQRRVTIGTYPAFTLDGARTEAPSLIARISRAEDPTTDRKPRADVFLLALFRLEVAR